MFELVHPQCRQSGCTPADDSESSGNCRKCRNTYFDSRIINAYTLRAIYTVEIGTYLYLVYANNKNIIRSCVLNSRFISAPAMYYVES